jgi:hypothetical protein
MQMKLEKTNEAYDCWISGEPTLAGKIIYEQLPVKERPFWAARLLNHCAKLIPSVAAVEKVLETALTPNLWTSAREAFDAVRALTLKDERQPASSNLYRQILYLAENTAKVTYNATGLPAPYDHNSGWRIIKIVRQIVGQVAKPEFETETWNLILKTN